MIDELIERSRAGDATAREELLVALRPQLRQWAEQALSARVATRMDASDLAQITLLDVHLKLDQFVGTTERELLDWLRKGLERNVIDAVRQATAQKRTVAREEYIDGVRPNESLPRNNLAADHSTPSMRAMRRENETRLEKALQQLLPDQQQVVRLVHLQGYSLGRAAAELDRSTAAVAKLLQRGVKNLRAALSETA